jgi:hypothetical protein
MSTFVEGVLGALSYPFLDIVSFQTPILAFDIHLLLCKTLFRFMHLFYWDSIKSF